MSELLCFGHFYVFFRLHRLSSVRKFLSEGVFSLLQIEEHEQCSLVRREGVFLHVVWVDGVERSLLKKAE